jgi:hypothetical protein
MIDSSRKYFSWPSLTLAMLHEENREWQHWPWLAAWVHGNSSGLIIFKVK